MTVAGSPASDNVLRHWEAVRLLVGAEAVAVGSAIVAAAVAVAVESHSNSQPSSEGDAFALVAAGPGVRQ